MEEIPEPEGGRWSRAVPPAPRKRLPGTTYLAWLLLIGAAAGLQGLRTAADAARRAGLATAGAALDALAVVGAVGLAAAVIVRLARRGG